MQWALPALVGLSHIRPLFQKKPHNSLRSSFNGEMQGGLIIAVGNVNACISLKDSFSVSTELVVAAVVNGNV